MRRWKPCAIEFGDPVSVRAEDPVSAAVWEGPEKRAEFAKPGGGMRAGYLLPGMVAPEDMQEILQAASQMPSDGINADGQLISRKAVMVSGQYQCSALARHVRPIVDTRLLPYIRHRYACPGAVVSDAFIRRDEPCNCTDTPVACGTEHLYYCTAMVALNMEDTQGGVYIQSAASVESQGLVPLASGDVLVHQYNLSVGVRVHSGVRYSLVFHFKDSILACLTNTAPWYRVLAEEGDADAQMNLALHLERGLNVNGQGSDLAAAALWYRRAAEQGHPDAQDRLGALYREGLGGLRQDASQAVNWWHKSALQGHRAAQRNLAEMLMRGEGTEKNEIEAMKWIQKSAEQDDADAMYLLCVAHAHGRGVALHRDLSLAWCERAARMGNAAAQYYLGSHYFAGEGLSRNLHEAVKWFQKAANAGHRGAQCNLGVCFAQGIGGLPRDYTKALHWYHEAAQGGDAHAQYNLALLHANGVGCSKDSRFEAQRWCGRAAEQGHVQAKALLSELSQGRCNVQLPCTKPSTVQAKNGTSQRRPEIGYDLGEGLPTLTLNECQQARLTALLTELQNMRRVPIEAEAEELISILRIVETASHSDAKPSLSHRVDTPAKVRALTPTDAPASAPMPAPPSPAAPASAPVPVPAPASMHVSSPAQLPAPSLTPAVAIAAAAPAAVAVAMPTAEAGPEAMPSTATVSSSTALTATAHLAPPASASAPEPVVRAVSEPPAPAPPEPAAPVRAPDPVPVVETTDMAPRGGPLTALVVSSEPRTACCRRQAVVRISARLEVELREAINNRLPVLVTGAMPHLSGARVPEFMPKLMSTAGTFSTAFEIQGSYGEAVQARQAPLAMYIQELSKSVPGRAYLMVSEEALSSPKLSEFLTPPSCCEPNIMGDLPAAFQPSSGCYLVVGGKGAMSQLHRDPVTWAGWNLLVLGRKRWHLFPPDTPREALSVQDGPWGSGTSPCDSFANNAASNGKPAPRPVLAEAVWEATQEMGEVLIIPPGWWHQTLHEDRTLAVMSQFVTEGAVLAAVAQEVNRWLSADSTWRGELHADDPQRLLESAAKQAMVTAETARPSRRATLRHSSLPHRDVT